MYLWLCIGVFVYLIVGNISFDVLGPWAFQKYSIIRFNKVFRAWWRPTNQLNLEQVCSWNSEQSRLLQKKIFHMTVNRRNICNSKACTNTRLSWNYNQYKENKMSDIILCIQCFGETSAAAAAASNDETMNHRPSKYVSLAACIFDQLVQQTKWEKNDNRTLITLDIPPLSAAAITDFCITYGFIDKC